MPAGRDDPDSPDDDRRPPPRDDRRRAARDPGAETDLGDLVMRLARSLRHRGAEVTAPWGLAPHQVRALRVVARHGDIRPGELAQHLRVAPRSVTDVVDSLEERGLVQRRPDPTDRRATVLTLTDDGRALVAKVEKARKSDAHAYFERLTDDDRAALRRILTTLEDDDDRPLLTAPPVRSTPERRASPRFRTGVKRTSSG